MIELLDESEVRAWLRRRGLSDQAVDRVMDGVDTTGPMYVRMLEPGEKLVQYRDGPSAEYPLGELGGQWFALPSLRGDELGRVGIGRGHAGRARHELTVSRHAEAQQTTAKAMRDPSDNSPEGSKPRQATERYRGDGRATQIFIPDRGMSCLGGQPMG